MDLEKENKRLQERVNEVCRKYEMLRKSLLVLGIEIHWRKYNGENKIELVRKDTGSIQQG